MSANEQTEMKPNRYSFNGKEQDQIQKESGFYYYGARYHDANSAKRFTTTDPFPINQNEPQSLNRYIFCYNNPVKYIDQNGKYPILSTLTTTNTECDSGYYYQYSNQLGETTTIDNEKTEITIKSSFWKSIHWGNLLKIKKEQKSKWEISIEYLGNIPAEIVHYAVTSHKSKNLKNPTTKEVHEVFKEFEHNNIKLGIGFITDQAIIKLREAGYKGAKVATENGPSIYIYVESTDKGPIFINVPSFKYNPHAYITKKDMDTGIENNHFPTITNINFHHTSDYSYNFNRQVYDERVQRHINSFLVK